MLTFFTLFQDCGWCVGTCLDGCVDTVYCFHIVSHIVGDVQPDVLECLWMVFGQSSPTLLLFM